LILELQDYVLHFFKKVNNELIFTREVKKDNFYDDVEIKDNLLIGSILGKIYISYMEVE